MGGVADPADDTLRDRPVPRAVLVLAGLGAAALGVAGLHAARGILGPLFLALVLTLLVQPTRTRLERRLPHWAATLVCLLLVYVFVLGLIVSIALSAVAFTDLLPTYQAEVDHLRTQLGAGLHAAGLGAEKNESVVQAVDPGRLVDWLTSALSGVLGFTSGIVLLLSIVTFMAIDATVFSRLLARTGGARRHMVAALREFGAATRRYLNVSTLFGVAVAVLDTIALLILGVPGALLWGFLAYLTNYIPNIGFLIGLVPPALLALLDSGPGLMIVVIAVYSVINLVLQTGIQPKVVGDVVGLSTTLTFLSVVFWTLVLGPVGALLAVPLTLLARAVLVDADPGTAWLSPFIANRDRAAPGRAT